MTASDRFIIWNHILRRHGEANRLTVDELHESLMADGHKYARSDAVRFLKYAAKERNLGWFRTGRRGWASRITWMKRPGEFGALDMGGLGKNGHRPVVITTMLEYPLQLRAGVTAKLLLPDNLSKGDVARLVHFVEQLPLA